MKISGSTETITERRLTGADLRRLVGAPEGASVRTYCDDDEVFLGDDGTVTITWRTVTPEEIEIEAPGQAEVSR